MTASVPPRLDPTPIFELFRGSYGTEFLTAAVAEFGVFERLRGGGKSFTELAAEIGLERRPANVLFTALAAMGLLTKSGERFELTAQAREHLLRDAPFFVGDYLGWAAEAPVMH